MMRGPANIEELLSRIAAHAKNLSKEQAQVVASCLEYALRGSQEERWYEIIDSIHNYEVPQTPLVQIGTMNGDINAIENKDHDHSDQQSQRKLQCIHERVQSGL